MGLKRQLSLLELTLMGVGMILGAGIYALVGIAGVHAGNSLWLAFAVAGVIAALTGLSYAELASMVPEAGSSFNYARHAFKNKDLAFLAGWLLAISSVIAAATVSLGFAHYVNALGINPVLLYSAIFVLFLSVFFNIKGLEIAAKVNDVAAVLEILGLIGVIIIGFALSPHINFGFDMPEGISGFFSAVALAFFAFLGFEVIANEAGEAKNPSKNVPLALILSVGISIVLYGLVTIAFTSMASYSQIVSFAQGSQGALASAVGLVAGAQALVVLSIVALFSTGNTVLLSITNASRTLYGMAVSKALPRLFSQTRNSTPVNALLFSGFVSLLLLFFAGIETVANAAVLGMLLVFALDNFAVIKLRFAEPHTKRPFKLPLNIANIPLTSLLGVLACLGLFAYSALQMPVALGILAGLVVLGLILKKVVGGSSSSAR